MPSLLIATWLLLVPTAEAEASRHRVVKGDSLWTIARAHGCDVDAVRRANPKMPSVLRIGAVLEVPRCGEPEADPPAAAEPSRGRSREPARTDPAPGVRRHHVEPGETLQGIAKRYRIPVAEIMRRNKLRSTTILVGRDLDVGEGPPRRPASTARRSGSASLPSLADEAASPEPAELADLPADLPAVVDDDEASRAAPVEDDDDDPIAARAVPATGTAGRSIGKPNRGRLEGGVQLPRDGAYHRRRPTRAFGAAHVVDLTRAAIAEVRRKHPRVHKLAIGDISDPDGGRLSGHRSHQSGRDVDIGLYFERRPRSYPARFVGADEAPLHIAATWTLVEAFYRQSKTAGGPIAIFLDYDLQKRLVEYGRKHGADKRVLREMFQYPSGRRSRQGLVRHEPGHHDHLHVRFACPPRDRACH